MKICILVLDNIKSPHRRKNSHFDGFAYTGLRRIVRDLHKKYTPEYCHVSSIGKYDFVLCTLTSFDDYYNLVYSFEKNKPEKNGCKVIVGGAGVVNINLIYKYIDIAVWGRGENQIVKIIDGEQFDNVWRKEDDPQLKKQYNIRQFVEPAEGNSEFVGCRNRCFYCGYTWHRKSNYSRSGHYKGSETYKQHDMQEDDWNGLNIVSASHYVSALDGLSQDTRFLVNKKITDESIKNKINELYERDFNHRIHLTVYMILGYPWETQKSIAEDWKELESMLVSLDRTEKKMKLNLFLKFTPFNPVPLTPMQYLASSPEINFRKAIGQKHMQCKKYVGRNIHIFFQSPVMGPLRLLEILFCSRAKIEDNENYCKMIFTNRLKQIDRFKAVDFLKTKGIVGKHIYGEITKNQSPFSYLKTYANIEKIATKLSQNKSYKKTVTV